MLEEIVAAEYEQSNRTHLTAMGASVRLCRRAELGHLLTGAAPWQTERQPRIFGDLLANASERPSLAVSSARSAQARTAADIDVGDLYGYLRRDGLGVAGQ
ncbi:MAG TPA: hypothetical protein VGD83_10015 [Streptosporangiaceae bacterium]